MKTRRLTPWVALATGAACAITATLVVGTAGLVGALIGGLIVVAFFGATPAVLGPVTKATPALSLVFALVFFFTKVAALFALFVVLRRSSGDSGSIDAESVSVTVIATTLAWLMARVFDATHERMPVYDLPDQNPVEPGDSRHD